MFEAITRCRSCGEGDLWTVLDLGHQYLSDFRPDGSKPPSAPLELVRCDLGCGLVQLAHTVDRTNLYTDNYGFRSGVNEGIVNDLKHVVWTGLDYVRSGSWLDIASNDGTLLSFVPKSFYRHGFDPVTKFKVEAEQHADVVTDDFFTAKACDGRLFDVVTSISMFYDIDDLNGFVSEVKSVLAPEGVWVIQQNYLLDMLQQGAVDNVCHEHLTYFSLNTLATLLNRHGLRIVKVERSDVNGGVIRTVVVHADSKWPEPRSVGKAHDVEAQYGLHLPGAYTQFADQARNNIEELRDLVNDLADLGQTIDIYGASTRGAVLWQAAGIDHRHIRQAVERQDEKVGKWFSPIGVPIVSEETMRADPPDTLLVGPWWHKDAFLAREQQFLHDGGAMVFPLPEVRVYTDTRVEEPA